ncbi:AraC family transcriptional regulator [Methylomonas sp. LW13]|uniref:helix-turn-helix transcriptional regulator n=1 Tax=unclassified Methylomonas TaxID=2608980 RepID=UPI00068E5E3E|nr:MULTISPECIES: AraC family transcriptional regulator [unclassified Methylomonas]PKD37995.1 AraC family transcriptional regulator [Methylomonas sp. Kb3]QBC28255.1 AraC family transcriptional regulator [Methylomonas sp. LW13]
MGQTPSSKILNWQIEGCHFSRFDISPEQSISLEKIFHDEIAIIGFSGVVWKSRQNGQNYLETPNCLVMRDAGQIFSLKSAFINKDGAICREIKISPRQLIDYCEKHELSKFVLDFKNPIIDNLYLRNYFADTHRVLEASQCALEQSTCLALFVNRFLQQVTGNHYRCPHLLKPWKVKISIEYLRTFYNRNISLNELSEVTKSNPFVLLRNFKKCLGITPHEYLQAYRIIQAKKFISTGVALTDVATLCGFADQSHLNRVFKRKVGVTPGQFRNV